MPLFHERIREARKKLGFPTAKEFHRRKNKELSMSYESYMNIETGKYLPPAERLEGLVQALEIEDIKGFAFAYCESLMPNELFKGLFSGPENSRSPVLLRSDSYTDYKEKFHALLEFNRMQAKYELSPEQIACLESDLAMWDIVNLFISIGDEGLTLQDIAEKTDSGVESTRRRVEKLMQVGMMRELPAKASASEAAQEIRYLVTQDAFIIPRRPIADRLTHMLVQREIDQCFRDKRNRPYTRFRFMAIDPGDRDHVETFIDNFILDSRRFKKTTGKTHYLQILFSDRHDLL